MGIPIPLSSKLLALICLGVLCVILTLGLWPFHVPANDVAWMEGRPGLRLGQYSTAIASGTLRAPDPGQESGGSVEIWLQPGRIWDSGTVLAFGVPGDPFQLRLRQSLADVEIETPRARLYAGDVFRKARPLFLTITSGGQGTRVYVDGVLVRTAVRFRLSAENFTGRLVAGDSPGQTDSWSGQLFGLAVYHRELPPSRVVRHYADWTQRGRPDIADDDRNVALYLVDEGAGRVIHDRSGNGPDLYIPERYTVLDQIFLEPFWREFSLSRSYGGAALKNIVGFVPFGFCFYAWLTALRNRRAVLATVLLGTAVSLTIEILQAYLPTRDSGTTDIFTNTLGTWIGVVLYKRFWPIVFGRS